MARLAHHQPAGCADALLSGEAVRATRDRRQGTGTGNVVGVC